MKIYTCAEWGAREPRRGTRGTRGAVGVVIHHTDGANRPWWAGDHASEREAGFAVLRAVQQFHTAPKSCGGRGWADTGYHFMVTRGGLVLEGRRGSLAAAQAGRVVYGAHAGVTEANARHWGVVLEGSYVFDTPTAVQWQAAVELLARLSLWGRTQAAAITGHCDWKATKCPGEALHRKLPALRREVKARKIALSAG